jgi:hypothetical protein
MSGTQKICKMFIERLIDEVLEPIIILLPELQLSIQ